MMTIFSSLSKALPNKDNKTFSGQNVVANSIGEKTSSGKKGVKIGKKTSTKVKEVKLNKVKTQKKAVDSLKRMFPGNSIRDLITFIIPYIYKGKFTKEFEDKVKNGNIKYNDYAKLVNNFNHNFKNGTDEGYWLNFYIVMRKMLEKYGLRIYVPVLYNTMLLFPGAMRDEKSGEFVVPSHSKKLKLNGILTVLINKKDLEKIKEAVKDTKFEEIEISKEEFEKTKNEVIKYVTDLLNVIKDYFEGASVALEKGKDEFLRFTKEYYTNYKNSKDNKEYLEKLNFFGNTNLDLKEIDRNYKNLNEETIKYCFDISTTYLKGFRKSVLERLESIRKLKYEYVKDLNKKLVVDKNSNCLNFSSILKNIRKMIKKNSSSHTQQVEGRNRGEDRENSNKLPKERKR